MCVQNEGGGGQGHFWTMSKRKTLFYVFPNMVENINITNWKHTLRKVLVHSFTHFSGEEHRPVLVSAITEYFDPLVNFIFIYEFLHTLKME